MSGGPPSSLPAVTAVLIPVKAFGAAKVRLAPAMDEASRAELARTMAERVVAAADPLPVWVVCDDDDVARWARSVGAQVCWKPGRGLNGAVQEGVDDLATAGTTRVVVAHADLPHALDLTWLADGHGVDLVPDRHRDGTNVMALPTAGGFRFAYGPGSFTRHHGEAVRCGLEVHVHDVPRLAWDVDTPDDLMPPGFAELPGRP